MRRPKPANNKRVITEHRCFYYPTSDEWSPNFPRDTVLVRVHDQTTGSKVFVRISVWGADDTGMEKDFYTNLKGKNAIIRELCKFADNLPNPLTKQYLFDNGFVGA